MTSLVIGEGIINISPGMAGFQAGVQRGVGRSFSALGIGAQQAGLALAPLSAAAGAALASSTALAIGYEKSFTQIEALVGESDQAIQDLKKSTLELATETGVGPLKLAEALFFVESAGLRGAEAADTLRIAARASAVGLGETATVADALTSATNAYATSGLTAATAGDVLVASVREGKLAADTLAGALGRVIPIAAAAGVEFHEVGAALAATTRIGLNAQEAATAIRQIMVTIIKPTQQAKKALAEYGLTAGDLQASLRDDGLLATLRTLRNTFGDNTTALTKVFGNIRALTGVLALVGENAEQTQQIFDALERSVGDLDVAFDKVQDDSAFQLSVALAQLQTAGISLGESLVPVLTQIATIGGNMAEIFASLPGPIQETVGRLLAITAVLAPMLLLAGGILRAAAAMQFLKAQKLQAAAATTAQAAAELELTAALTAQTGAIGLNRSALIGRQGAMFGGRFSGFFAGTPGKGLKGAGAGVGAIIAAQIGASIVQSLPGEEGGVADQIQDTIAGAMNGAALGFLVGSVLPISIPLTTAIGGILGAGVGFFSSIGDGAEEAVLTVTEALKAIDSSVRDTAGLFDRQGDVLGASAEEAAERIAPLVASLRDVFENGGIDAANAALNEVAFSFFMSQDPSLTPEQALSRVHDLINEIDRQTPEIGFSFNADDIDPGKIWQDALADVTAFIDGMNDDFAPEFRDNNDLIRADIDNLVEHFTTAFLQVGEAGSFTPLIDDLKEIESQGGAAADIVGDIAQGLAFILANDPEFANFEIDPSQITTLQQLVALLHEVGVLREFSSDQGDAQVLEGLADSLRTPPPPSVNDFNTTDYWYGRYLADLEDAAERAPQLIKEFTESIDITDDKKFEFEFDFTQATANLDTFIGGLDTVIDGWEDSINDIDVTEETKKRLTSDLTLEQKVEFVDLTPAEREAFATKFETALGKVDVLARIGVEIVDEGLIGKWQTFLGENESFLAPVKLDTDLPDDSTLLRDINGLIGRIQSNVGAVFVPVKFLPGPIPTKPDAPRPDASDELDDKKFFNLTVVNPLGEPTEATLQAVLEDEANVARVRKSFST